MNKNPTPTVFHKEVDLAGTWATAYADWLASPHALIGGRAFIEAVRMGVKVLSFCAIDYPELKRLAETTGLVFRSSPETMPAVFTGALSEALEAGNREAILLFLHRCRKVQNLRIHNSWLRDTYASLCWLFDTPDDNLGPDMLDALVRMARLDR